MSVAAQLQLAMAIPIDKHINSGKPEPEIIVLTKTKEGLEISDASAVSQNSDMLGHLFRLWKGKLPCNPEMTAAWQTLDTAYDGQIGKGFGPDEKIIFYEYETAKLRALHATAKRICRRHRKSELVRINHLRSVYDEHVKPVDTSSETTSDEAVHAEPPPRSIPAMQAAPVPALVDFTAPPPVPGAPPIPGTFKKSKGKKIFICFRSNV